MPLTPREELLKIQQQIFKRNDLRIRRQAMVQERGFRNYEQEYRRRVRDFESISSQEELLKAIAESDVIYLGDYHTNPQSQRTLLRILKQIVATPESKIGIGIELVMQRHQKVLDQFLQGRLKEETFLKKIRFKKYWYFDLWENFKPIFDFARFHEIPVSGIEYSLEGHASLARRDRGSAEIVASLIEKHPDMKLIVFVGDLHVAPSHLPGRVRHLLEKKNLSKKDLIIYQNSDQIYWKLAEKEMEDKVEIVRVSEREFCIINTPPIVWQQTYLNWLEHEEGEIDYLDAKQHFLDFLKREADFLQISLPNGFEEAEVFTCGDLSFLKSLSDDGDFSKKEIKRIKRQVLASESYCIPSKRTVYLANLSLNHAAEEAAHYLKFLCAGEEFPREPVDAFYANILHEALGFFGSKIINHKRKCFHEKEYMALANFLRNQRGRKRDLEISLLVLKHRVLDKKEQPIRSKQFYRGRHDLFFGVTHALGYMLGDRLYYALIQEKTTKEEIRELFLDRMKKEGSPYELYKKVLRKVKGIKIPKRV